MHDLNTPDEDIKHFNIMVCGASGIGKTSFIDLFMKKFNLDDVQDISSYVGKTTR